MSARRNYATTGAAPQLAQLRVLHASMQRHCRPFRLHVLAEGPEVAAWARAQTEVDCAPLDAFLAAHADLAPAALPGRPRTPNELACTWRWRFVADLVERFGEPVTLVDADLMFWSSPEPVFEEIGPAPAAVLPHSFAAAAAGLPGPTIESHSNFGIYNGGFSYWADAGPAARMAALARECSRADVHRWTDGRVTWGDQGALALIEEEFGAHVIKHPGAAPGPWCVHTQPLETITAMDVRSRDHGGRVAHSPEPWFGGRPLVAWHYSGLRRTSGGFQPSWAEYAITPAQEQVLYRPYYAALERAA